MVVSRVFPYAGSGYLISSPNSVLFLRSATAPVAAELWQHLRGSAGFSRVLSSLLERAELDFTFATAAADATLVVARGFVVNDADGGLINTNERIIELRPATLANCAPWRIGMARITQRREHLPGLRLRKTLLIRRWIEELFRLLRDIRGQSKFRGPA